MLSQCLLVGVTILQMSTVGAKLLFYFVIYIFWWQVFIQWNTKCYLAINTFKTQIIYTALYVAETQCYFLNVKPMHKGKSQVLVRQEISDFWEIALYLQV